MPLAIYCCGEGINVSNKHQTWRQYIPVVVKTEIFNWQFSTICTTLSITTQNTTINDNNTHILYFSYKFKLKNDGQYNCT